MINFYFVGFLDLFLDESSLVVTETGLKIRLWNNGRNIYSVMQSTFQSYQSRIIRKEIFEETLNAAASIMMYVQPPSYHFECRISI